MVCVTSDVDHNTEDLVTSERGPIEYQIASGRRRYHTTAALICLLRARPHLSFPPLTTNYERLHQRLRRRVVRALALCFEQVSRGTVALEATRVSTAASLFLWNRLCSVRRLVRFPEDIRYSARFPRLGTSLR